MNRVAEEAAKEIERNGLPEHPLQELAVNGLITEVRSVLGSGDP